MSNTSKNLLKFLSTSGLIMAAAVALNFVVDPLQVFRPARLFAAMYSPDSRLQDAGLIQNQDFDTVFMGTSLAIHFRQSDIDRLNESSYPRALRCSLSLSSCRGC